MIPVGAATVSLTSKVPVTTPAEVPISTDVVAYSRFPMTAIRDVGSTGTSVSTDKPADKLTFSFEGPYADPVVNVIAPHVDRSFYLQTYPDMAKAGVDPAVHFADFGWREGRDPNAWFDSDYYLATYADVRHQDINPFWHYLVAGQHEGRSARGKTNFRRNLLEKAAAPSSKPAYDVLPQDSPELDADALSLAIEAAIETADGIVMSVSHDCYIHNTGGTQLFIADEENKFVGNRLVYCHISPAIARLTLSPPGEPSRMQVVLDGAFVGIASYNVLVDVLQHLPEEKSGFSFFIIHSLLGHDVDSLAAVARALRAEENFFWLHDFSSVCEGFNLLRNDVAFCGGPPASSMGCRVCIYGSERQEYLTRVRSLFERVGFHVVAPSRSALDLWLKVSDLPYIDARVHEHCRLNDVATEASDVSRIDNAGPARVAFIGQPGFHKGYPFFREIVVQARDSTEYKFYHFGNADCLIPIFGVTLVATSVTRSNPRAMANALRQHNIDLVLVLSPWPETFSYVTFEAFAAGADVIALSDGGNVPMVIRNLQRGIVIRDENALYDVFASGRIWSYVTKQRAAGKQYNLLEFCGTTATIKLDNNHDHVASNSQTPTRDPALRAAAGGRIVDPVELGNNTYRFQLPPDCASVRLISRSVVPVWTTSTVKDNRRLGVAVSAIRLDDKTLPINDTRLVGGWYEPEAQLRWTDGNATVMAGGARTFEVTISPKITYWHTDHGEAGLRLISATVAAERKPNARTPLSHGTIAHDTAQCPPQTIVPDIREDKKVGSASSKISRGRKAPSAKCRGQRDNPARTGD